MFKFEKEKTFSPIFQDFQGMEGSRNRCSADDITEVIPILNVYKTEFPCEHFQMRVRNKQMLNK